MIAFAPEAREARLMSEALIDSPLTS